MDRLIFAIWDRFWLLRPQGLSLALRLDPAHCEAFRTIYFRSVLRKASPRVWRYIESRRPDTHFLCRIVYPMAEAYMLEQEAKS